MQLQTTTIELFESSSLAIVVTENVTTDRDEDSAWEEFEIVLISVQGGTMAALSEYLQIEGGAEHIASLLDYHRPLPECVNIQQARRNAELSYLYDY